MKRIYFFIAGSIAILISMIIYLTKGRASTCQPIYGCITNTRFMLHLFWSMLISFLGMGLIFVGVMKNE